MDSVTSDIVRRLANQAEAVCRRYLSNGRRVGAYWIVGDVRNAKGRSLFVRLASRDGAPAGKWTDAATGEHGDLLDVIAAAVGAESHGEALDEARQFLGVTGVSPSRSFPHNGEALAARIFAAARRLEGGLGTAYLADRGLDHRLAGDEVRFAPHCSFSDGGARRSRPALISAVRDDKGAVVGILRTYLTVATPPTMFARRALGRIRGKGVVFGVETEAMIIAEGLETALSVRMALRGSTVVSALSAAHLALWTPPPTLRRLYIAADRDAAGLNAAERLAARARAGGTTCETLFPLAKDFNDDLRAHGVEALRTRLLSRLDPVDRCAEAYPNFPR